MQVKLFSLVFLWTLVPCSGPVVSAQQGQGGLTLGGRVSAGLSLSVLQGDMRGRATVESAGSSFAYINIEGGEQGEDSAIILPLEIRTNIGYELKYSLLETEGCSPPIRVSIESVRASGPWVMPLAAEESRQQAVEIARAGGTAQILSGPRVSAKGALAARSNALLVVVKFQGEQAQSRGCGWKARIQVSLHSNGIV